MFCSLNSGTTLKECVEPWVSTDGGQQGGGVLDVGGGLLDGAARGSLSFLSFLERLFHLLCRVLHICCLPAAETQEVTFLLFITRFRGETFRPKYEDGSFDLTWVTVRLKCVLDEQVGLT